MILRQKIINEVLFNTKKAAPSGAAFGFKFKQIFKVF